MANLTANLTCHKCNKNFEKVFYDSGSGAYKRLKEKVEWAERSGSFLCPECYKEERRAEDKKKGLVAEIKVCLVASDEINIVFTGDTYPHKDKLKELGCRWTDDYPSDFLGMSRPPKAWVYCTTVDKADDACDVILKSGAKFKIPDNLDMTLFQAFRRLRQENKSQATSE